ncbi:DUF6520 family protein [Algoriphagus yeomjeoni]|uniref:Uncharacterized protein n=1 Tax=Algoriphagus yeomjeoni TaxID=291403 RepID=A0A327PRE7_9BACT|nr:DUF6520 family protein [Algoriphagus yeomjeoni]RAI93834.1 hypothetical protein LV83_00740 [Algoriphagus yeomjeoni]
MKNLVKRLPLFAFVLAAFAAFAFNAPAISMEKPTSKVWTPDSNAPNGYREITGEIEETNYLCDEGGLECAVTFLNDDPSTGVKIEVEPGTYMAIP